MYLQQQQALFLYGKNLVEPENLQTLYNIFCFAINFQAIGIHYLVTVN